ncbi:RNA pyrophosphohydrolase [Campylobacter sp. MIT 99-7217]|uniref:RNA pyrophosphohydrolase n=1 Tax=Campylobacter sp. MIT 99-7217 TaxID=535091 RepID=UPI00115B8EA5|nr:RNA pyrophosphohydrolase [Campylobacter sp. MIT 99-7217]TQR33723.1 RNA pyrophosphohydrolase [Campylobacter sp. MIT 99-7217]
MEKEKKYRANVAAIVLSNKYPFECRILLGERSDMKGIWQLPQGGIDKGEDAKKALFRELKEEIGTDEVEIISSYPEWLYYDFPANAKAKMYPYDGQKQKYFLVRLKDKAKIDIHTKDAEFSAYEFVNLKKFFEVVNHFKKPLYSKVIKHFQEKGYI